MTSVQVKSSNREQALWRARRDQAENWFISLRDRICACFESLEDRGGANAENLPPGRFERKITRRGSDNTVDDLGGGVTSIMREGRVFEKVGVNVSAVYGELDPDARKAITARKEVPGLADDPRFWASGISLVAHMRNPRVPAAHMNTRFFWTPSASWFGGGADINPTRPKTDPAYSEDAAAFHAVMREACERHSPDYYPRFKAWADEYFMIRHWKEPRGAGGVFYDDLDTGDWEADFAFTQSIGEAFLNAFQPLVEKRAHEAWSDDERAYQLFRRGRYAEFNLIYDRGTHFGLATGHNPEAVLMSLPPLATWP
jgi:coproporphyrinogen III oxidase